MPKAKLMQSTFNSGILSPQVSQRIDLDKYYRGAQDIRNGIVMPQGGVSKRNGFEKLIEMTTVKEDEKITKAGQVVFPGGDEVKLMTLKFSKSEGYTIVLFGSGFGYVVDNFSGRIFELVDDNEFGDEFVTALGDQVTKIQYVQIENSIVYVHPLSRPKKISIGTDRAGNILFRHENLKVFGPTIDFSAPIIDVTGTQGQPATIGDFKTLSFENMENGDQFALCVNIDRNVKIITYQVDYVEVTPETKTGDTIGDNVDVMLKELNEKCEFHGIWFKKWKYRANVKTTKKKIIVRKTQDVREEIEVNESKFISISLNPEFDYGYKSSRTGVICVGKSTHKGKVTLVTNFSRMLGPGGKTSEYAWSPQRGFPATLQLHGGRLVFGGTPYLPQSLFFSRIDDIFNFRTDPKPTAVSAIFVTLSTREISPITGMISTRKLIVMTTATMHTVQGDNDSVITADTINSTVISNNGSRLSQPIDFDSKIFYLQFSGASLNSTKYDYMQDSYTSSQAALLSPSVLVDPLVMDKVVGSNEYNTNYLAVLNSDGTIAYYNSLEEQAINNWTILETDGLFCALSAINEDLNVITRRPNGNSTTMLFERMSPNNEYVDSYQRITASDSIDKLTGMLAYAGKIASVKIDGFPMNLPINDDGTIDLPFTGKDIVYGLPYELKIVTMPLNTQFESGPILNAKKRVIRANVELLHALDVSLEYENREYDIQNRKMGFDLDSPPEPLTGNYTARFTGWTKKANVAIKSSLPVPATILSIELEVKTGG